MVVAPLLRDQPPLICIHAASCRQTLARSLSSSFPSRSQRPLKPRLLLAGPPRAPPASQETDAYAMDAAAPCSVSEPLEQDEIDQIRCLLLGSAPPTTSLQLCVAASPCRRPCVPCFPSRAPAPIFLCFLSNRERRAYSLPTSRV
ncbi:uncharacterized protein LOC119293768 [Triticum dicoccoides]|uniref:uncharacterized protein LOC119293768 n=1 Tax=Triticum dicoccoides TaxID=85692 RepID=UPI00188FBBEC|nr:uncharacterized protein LOC119293768 [Triticum dicoccoides]